MQNYFFFRCAQCDGAILDQCVSALDKTWHPEHFVCASCSNPFGVSIIYLKVTGVIQLYLRLSRTIGTNLNH